MLLVFNEVFVFEICEEDLKCISIMCEVCRGDIVLKIERIGYIIVGLELFFIEVWYWNDMIMLFLKRIMEIYLLYV